MNKPELTSTTQIRFKCENCLQSIKAKPEQVGKYARCPNCKNSVEVPNASTTHSDYDEYDLAPISIDPDAGSSESLSSLLSPATPQPKKKTKKSKRPKSSSASASEIDLETSFPEQEWAEPLPKLPGEESNGPRPAKTTRSTLTHHPVLETVAVFLRLLAWITGLVFACLLLVDIFGLSLSEDSEPSQSGGLAYKLGLVLTACTLVCIQIGASESIRVLLEIHKKLHRS